MLRPRPNTTTAMKFFSIQLQALFVYFLLFLCHNNLIQGHFLESQDRRATAMVEHVLFLPIKLAL